jgi:anti-sigma factor RsiW
MNFFKNCSKYQELITEAVDGLITLENMGILKTHMAKCHKCENAYKDMKKMVKLTSDLRVKEPQHLETRIMAAVRIAEKSADSGFVLNLRPVFIQAASFMTVILAGLFIYNNTSITPLPSVAKKPAQAEVTLAKAVEPAKKTVSKEAAVPEVVKPEVIAQTVLVEEKTDLLPLAAKGRELILEPAHQSPAASLQGEASRYTVAAKPTQIPPSDNPLLEQDKVIVANNMLDPSTGSAVTIRVKVEEDSKVKVVIYDRSVNPVSTLIDEIKSPGIYSVNWYGRNSYGQIVTEGIYYVYVQVGQRVIKKNIIITK